MSSRSLEGLNGLDNCSADMPKSSSVFAVADAYGTRKSPQLDKPGFSQINLVFLQINLVFLKKPHFSGEKPGLSEIILVFLR